MPTYFLMSFVVFVLEVLLVHGLAGDCENRRLYFQALALRKFAKKFIEQYPDRKEILFVEDVVDGYRSEAEKDFRDERERQRQSFIKEGPPEPGELRWTKDKREADARRFGRSISGFIGGKRINETKE